MAREYNFHIRNLFFACGGATLSALIHIIPDNYADMSMAIFLKSASGIGLYNYPQWFLAFTSIFIFTGILFVTFLVFIILGVRCREKWIGDNYYFSFVSGMFIVSMSNFLSVVIPGTTATSYDSLGFHFSRCARWNNCGYIYSSIAFSLIGGLVKKWTERKSAALWLAGAFPNIFLGLIYTFADGSVPDRNTVGLKYLNALVAVVTAAIICSLPLLSGRLYQKWSCFGRSKRVFKNKYLIPECEYEAEHMIKKDSLTAKYDEEQTKVDTDSLEAGKTEDFKESEASNPQPNTGSDFMYGYTWRLQ